MLAQTIVVEDLDYICYHLQEAVPILSGKKILITGGAGFLGYYLIQALLAMNAKALVTTPIHITLYDNFIRGLPDWLLPLKANIHLVKHDIAQQEINLADDFDYIMHAASIASPIFYRQHPIKTMDTNVNGLRHILDYAVNKQALNKPVTGILYFSSSEIYGDPTPENIPTPESYFGHVSCTGPRACYDESKRYGETLCVNFVQQYQLPIKIVRPFNNYGPGLKITDRRVIPDFANNILQGKDILLLSDGQPKRTFCYVADAMVGYFKTLLYGRNGEAYNIGVDAPEISIADLAQLMVSIAQQTLHYSGKVTFSVSEDQQYLTDNPQRRCPVIIKAKQELGYQPTITLAEGIKRSLLWYKENCHAAYA